MAPVILSLRAQASAEVTVLSTGQHRQLTRQVLSIFGVEIDHDLDVMTHDQSLAKLSSRLLDRLDTFLIENPQDLLLVQGDTTSVMIASIVAFYHGVQVGHVEAGLRTHDFARPFPEELNRVIASKISAQHFCPTDRARDNLLREGISAETIHVTGNTVIDALKMIADREHDCPFPIVRERRLILVTAHRRENFGEPLRQICRAILELRAAFDDVEFVYPVHPNPNVREPVHELLGGLDRINLIGPADYDLLVQLMRRSCLILTDSGGIQEEAPALGKPVLVLRDETERPEAITAGVASLVGASQERIVSAVSELLNNRALYERMATGGSPYGDGHAAERIVRICLKLESRSPFAQVQPA